MTAAERKRAYREAMTPEQREEYLRKARERNSRRNPAAVAASRRAWAKRYPERARRHRRIQESARRARLNNAFVEHVDPDVVWRRDCGTCGICGSSIAGDFHVDHIIPLARGGLHCYDNVQAAHPSCNEFKGCRTTP